MAEDYRDSNYVRATRPIPGTHRYARLLVCRECRSTKDFPHVEGCEVGKFEEAQRVLPTTGVISMEKALAEAPAHGLQIGSYVVRDLATPGCEILGSYPNAAQALAEAQKLSNRYRNLYVSYVGKDDDSLRIYTLVYFQDGVARIETPFIYFGKE